MADEIDAATENDDRGHGPENENRHQALLQFEVQTLTVFMPASASVRDL